MASGSRTRLLPGSLRGAPRAPTPKVTLPDRTQAHDAAHRRNEDQEVEAAAGPQGSTPRVTVYFCRQRQRSARPGNASFGVDLHVGGASKAGTSAKAAAVSLRNPSYELPGVNVEQREMAPLCSQFKALRRRCRRTPRVSARNLRAPEPSGALRERDDRSSAPWLPLWDKRPPQALHHLTVPAQLTPTT